MKPSPHYSASHHKYKNVENFNLKDQFKIFAFLLAPNIWLCYYINNFVKFSHCVGIILYPSLLDTFVWKSVLKSHDIFLKCIKMLWILIS